jgi:20S proteasome subunit alpha 6
MGIAISGLAGDGRSLTNYMRKECLNHKFVYESPMNTERLTIKVADSKN